MGGRLFYTIAIAFASGIFIRSFFDISLLFVCMLVLVGTAVALLYRVRSSESSSAVVLLVVALFAGSLGIIRFDISTLHDDVPAFNEQVGYEVQIEGVVAKEVDRRARTAQIMVDTETLGGEVVDERVLVIADRFVEVGYGDRVVATGVLSRPDTFETDLGRTFDYPGYLSARGVTYTLPFAEVTVLEEGEGNRVVSSLLALKHTFMRSIESILPEPQAGLAEGLVLGVKRALGSELEHAFRITGIIHIVVLSGYNVSIVAEGIMRLLSAFFRPKTRVVFGVIAIAAFAVIAGLSATVVRASIMGSLVLLARATGRTYAMMRALTVAGLAMLLVNPKLLAFDPGFQLSFLATMGLIFLAPLLEERFKLVPTRFQVREFITATIATQIFVLPLLLYSIGEFSVVAVIVNVLVLPAVPAAMLLIFLAGMIDIFAPMLALPIAFLAHGLLSYIIQIAERFAALPFAAFPVPAFPFWIVVVSYGLLALLLWRAAKSPGAQHAPGDSPLPFR